MSDFERRSVPSIGEVLRTPESRFADITDYPWPVSEVLIEPGLRMAYVDAGPSDAAETVLLLHGEPLTVVRPSKVMAWRSADWAGRGGFQQTGRWRFS